jgi:hypothetical protein
MMIATLGRGCRLESKVILLLFKSGGKNLWGQFMNCLTEKIAIFAGVGAVREPPLLACHFL